MGEPISSSAALKMGVGILGASFIYASAAVVDSAIPVPSMHGAMEVLTASLLAWVVRELKFSKSTSSMPGNAMTATQSSWRESMLKLAEEAAVGTQDIEKKLSLHREEFTEFRGETRSRLVGLECKVDRMENRMGDVAR